MAFSIRRKVKTSSLMLSQAYLSAQINIKLASEFSPHLYMTKIKKGLQFFIFTSRKLDEPVSLYALVRETYKCREKITTAKNFPV